METEDVMLADGQDLPAQSEPATDKSDEDQYEDEEFDETVLDGYVTDDGLVREREGNIIACPPFS